MPESSCIHRCRWRRRARKCVIEPESNANTCFFFLNCVQKNMWWAMGRTSVSSRLRFLLGRAPRLGNNFCMNKNVCVFFTLALLSALSGIRFVRFIAFLSMKTAASQCTYYFSFLSFHSYCCCTRCSLAVFSLSHTHWLSECVHYAKWSCYHGC